MKRILMLTLLWLVLCVTGAFGEVHDFERFTIDVIEGWEAEQNGSSVEITRKDNMAQVAVTITKMGEGDTLKELADYLADKYKEGNFTDVTEPVKKSDGSYSFSAVNPHGANTNVSMTVFGDSLIVGAVIIAKGHEEGAVDDINKILGSISINIK